MFVVEEISVYDIPIVTRVSQREKEENASNYLSSTNCHVFL